MKALAAISFTLALAAVRVVSAAECTDTELLNAVPPDATLACVSATGFLFIPPIALPTTVEVKAICTKCPELLAALNKKKKLPSCTVVLSDGSRTFAQYAATITNQCTKTSPTPEPTPTSTPTTSGSSSGGSNGANTPAPTTPQVTGSSLGPIDILPSSTTETTAPTTTTPRVLPIASADMRSVTLGAAAVALACTISGLTLL